MRGMIAWKSIYKLYLTLQWPNFSSDTKTLIFRSMILNYEEILRGNILQFESLCNDLLAFKQSVALQFRLKL